MAAGYLFCRKALPSFQRDAVCFLAAGLDVGGDVDHNRRGVQLTLVAHWTLASARTGSANHYVGTGYRKTIKLLSSTELASMMLRLKPPPVGGLEGSLGSLFVQAKIHTEDWLQTKAPLVWCSPREPALISVAGETKWRKLKVRRWNRLKRWRLLNSLNLSAVRRTTQSSRETRKTKDATAAPTRTTERCSSSTSGEKNKSQSVITILFK